MKKRLSPAGIYCIAFAVIIMFVPHAFADSLVSTDGGTWHSGWTANESGSPFWSNGSWDGSQLNIGYYISHTGSFTSQYQPYSGPGSNLPYLGIGTGADANFYFVKDSSQSVAALKLEIAGDAGYNQFGYYDFDKNGNRVDHLIFDGSANSSSAPLTFTPQSANYGFYFVGKSSANNVIGKWYTDGSGANFAVFSATNSGVYWIGMEDLQLSGSDKDYNDMVVKVSSVPVPEPATVLFLGLGLLGLSGMRRKFKK